MNLLYIFSDLTYTVDNVWTENSNTAGNRTGETTSSRAELRWKDFCALEVCN